MQDEGLLLVISGPAAVGKGTVCQILCRDNPGLYYSVSLTTRPPRPGEQDGISYRFVSEDEFRLQREQGNLLEWAEVHGNYYGTPGWLVEEKRKEGHDVILEIDIQGARQIRRNINDGVFIFLLPPAMQDLLKRIQKRGADAPDEIKRRLTAAYRELEELENYDYLVINKEIETAVTDIKAIITAEKCRVNRHPDILKRLFEEGDDFDLSLHR